MRVTQSMYYDNLYGTNNSKLNRELFDVNKGTDFKDLISIPVKSEYY